MKRLIDLHLVGWMTSPHRKPLLLRGARQVGKTFAARTLGGHFQQFIEINFEKDPQLREIFEYDLRPERLLRDLSAALNKRIVPGETLLFFDEIQEAPKAITALRYFYEEVPTLHIIAAGSLLDFTLDEIGAPVGRLSSFHLYPLSWVEFLKAKGEELLLETILKHDIHESIHLVLHERALRLLAEYFAVGGMPEAVQSWITSQDPRVCLEVHQSIITFYRQDFQKYAKKHNIKYVESVFVNVPHQIGQKFKFTLVPGEYRKRELYPALDLLEKAGVIHKIHHSAGHGIPLGAESNLEKFKVIFLDIALTQALLELNVVEWLLQPGQNFINKGALVEAFVGQELLVYANPIPKASLYYWQREAKNSQAEVDYLIQKQTDIIPVEVKSEEGRTLKSIHLFLEAHPTSNYGIRFSRHNYSVHNKIRSYPLYAVFSLQNDQTKEDIFQYLSG